MTKAFTNVSLNCVEKLLYSCVYIVFCFYCDHILLLRYYNIKGAISNFEYCLNTSLQNMTFKIHIDLKFDIYFDI